MSRTARDVVLIGRSEALSQAVADAFERDGYTLRRIDEPTGETADPARWRRALAGCDPEVALVLPGWRGAGALLDTPGALWREALRQNVESVVYALQATARRMIEGERGGTIVLLLHLAALAPLRGLGVLGTSHAALVALVRMMAVDLAPHAVTVHALAVGPLVPGDPALPADADARARLERDTPRPVDPAEVAALCRLLASEAGGALTGATLPAAGGFLLTRGEGASPYASPYASPSGSES